MYHGNNNLDEPRGVLGLVFGAMASCTLRAAVLLGVTDHIGPGATSASDVAKACGAQEDTVRRLLRTLVAMGLCTEDVAGSFELTPTGAVLRRDHVNSMRSTVLLFTSPVMLSSWQHLEASVRTGRPSFDELHGMPVFEYAARDQELTALFNDAMHQATLGVARVVSHYFDFSRFTRIVDVGGNDGTLLAEVLRAAPGAKGCLFDTPHTVAAARRRVAAEGVADRCDLQSGDFFQDVPPGGDLYLLKSVVHDWDDDRATVILRNCAAHLPDGGRIVIIEPVLPDRASVSTPTDVFLSDLNVLVNMGGRERTQQDFDDLCARCGLEVVDVTSPPGFLGFSLIEVSARR